MSDTPNPVEHSESLPVPGLPIDWHVKATNKLVTTVDQVKVKTAGPAIKISRAAVFGLLAALILCVALIVFLIGIVRFAKNLLVLIFSEDSFFADVWLVYLLLGSLFLAVGAFIWSKRPRRAAS